MVILVFLYYGEFVKTSIMQVSVGTANRGFPKVGTVLINIA